MPNAIISAAPASRQRPWNKGRLTGPKPPLQPKHVWAIRTHLQLADRKRDLALFNLALQQPNHFLTSILGQRRYRQRKSRGLILLQRVLAALVGIPLLVGAIWWGFPWLLLLVLAASLLALAEFYRLLPQDQVQLPAGLGLLWVAALVVGGQASTGLSSFLLISGIICFIGSFLSLLWLIAFYRGENPWQAAIYLVGGPIYVGIGRSQ